MYRMLIFIVALCALAVAQAATDAPPATPGQAKNQDPAWYAERYAQARALYEAGRYRDSFDRFRELAEAGFPPAKLSLAYQFEKGQGVFPNPRMALKWYRSAADDGKLAAITALAFAYREGKIARRNPALSYGLFLVVQRMRPGKATDALVQAAEEGLSDDDKRLGRQLAREMQPGHGAISRIIEQAERIGLPAL